MVPKNASSLSIIDEDYYVDVLRNRGLFTSDQSLITDTATENQVRQNARNFFLWQTKFTTAMVKMRQLNVVTGNAGEIRANCRAINR